MGSSSPYYPDWMSDEAMEEARERSLWWRWAAISWGLVGLALVAFVALIACLVVAWLLVPGR
jgi:hypothetical protein